MDLISEDNFPNIASTLRKNVKNDYIKNIKEFESKSGMGIHHTDTDKTLRELKNLGFK